MERTDAKAINDALAVSAMPGGAALTGVATLCRELKKAGVLPSDAVDRVRDAMVADINAATRIEYMARTRAIHTIQRMFVDPEAE